MCMAIKMIYQYTNLEIQSIGLGYYIRNIDDSLVNPLDVFVLDAAFWCTLSHVLQKM